MNHDVVSKYKNPSEYKTKTYTFCKDTVVVEYCIWAYKTPYLSISNQTSRLDFTLNLLFE